jgi:hypothetical protein
MPQASASRNLNDFSWKKRQDGWSTQNILGFLAPQGIFNLSQSFRSHVPTQVSDEPSNLVVPKHTLPPLCFI